MRIAIVGTGITGLSAAWLLNKAGHDIVVYEQNDYIGGHTNTVEATPHPAVDTGFIVFNDWTYPNLIALFKHLDVETMPSDMSFAASLDEGKLEYAGHALFAQKRNLLNPFYYRMLFDLIRFYKAAPGFLESGDKLMTLGHYLKINKYSRYFIDWHLLPMAAAIWSVSAKDAESFPASSFIRFFVNHGLLLMNGRPTWRTVKGGSREYVRKITASFAAKIRAGCAVTGIERLEKSVVITDKTGKVENFDHVIIAAHADQALSLLRDPSHDEQVILAAFPYVPNTTYLHTDESLMPERKSVWASWNYLASTKDNRVCVTYWMNNLQKFLPRDKNLFVTLNPPRKPASDTIIREIHYHHPQFNLDSYNAWPRIRTINGINRTWFCGAWCGYGFHEDGLSAGLAVAEALGKTQRPWTATDKSPSGKNVRPI